MPRSTLLATVAGLIGVVMWFTAISLAAISYSDGNAMPYSCWNHTISELGFPEVSQKTWLFNGTLAINGLMILPIIYALGAHLRTRLGYVAAGFGFITGLSLGSIGILGLKQDFFLSPYSFLQFLKIHCELAVVFFCGSLVTVTLFTVIFCRHWKDPVSRLMALVGIICWLAYPTILIVGIYANPTQEAISKDLINPTFRTILDSQISSPTQWFDSHRPHIWWAAALEWTLAWLVLLWHGMVLFFLWIKEREVTDPQKRTERLLMLVDYQQGGAFRP